MYISIGFFKGWDNFLSLLKNGAHQEEVNVAVIKAMRWQERALAMLNTSPAYCLQLEQKRDEGPQQMAVLQVKRMGTVQQRNNEGYAGLTQSGQGPFITVFYHLMNIRSFQSLEYHRELYSVVRRDRDISSLFHSLLIKSLIESFTTFQSLLCA